MRPLALVLPALLLALPLAGCLGDGAAVGTRERPASGSFTVDLREFQFAPREIWVKKGTTVGFRNADEAIHSVEASDGSWTLQDVKPGAAKTRAFSETGDAAIRCKYHKVYRDMNAVVHVVP